jgi:uncharacterized protein YecE (DUF72 family)
VARHLVGTTSWTYADWHGSFYPTKTPPQELLTRYARVFPLVECDATFYRMPSPDTTKAWAAATPKDFRMTVKLSRRITHESALVGVQDAVEAFLARITPLREAGKLAALLAQFPPSLARGKAGQHLEAFLDLFPADVRLALEFRNKSWFVPETYEALRSRNRALVWGVEPGEHTPPEVTADFLYCRLIGPDRIFSKFDHLQRDLAKDVEAFRDRLLQAVVAETFVLCSNHFAGHGPSTAAQVMEALGLGRPPMEEAMKPVGAQRGLGDF